MLLLTFLAGFAGSLHCIGMCGPIVLAYSTQPHAAVVPAWRAALDSTHLFYNGGRLTGYVLLGAGAGLVGGLLGSIRAIAPYVAIGAGILVILAGAALLGLFSTRAGNAVLRPGRFRLLQFRWAGKLLSLRTPESVFYVGILTALLPCGLLYAMVFQAAASGSALHGAVLMLSFGAGTVPALLFAGALSSLVGANLRSIAHRVAAVMLIVMGVALVVRGYGMLSVGQEPSPAPGIECPLHPKGP